jgi:hypothetical protein
LDYFGKESLRELLLSDGAPAVSVYLPMERSSTGREANRLRFRAALTEARRLLEEDYPADLYAPLLQPLERLVDDQDYWLYQTDGLALFASPAMERRYRLPVPFEELVVVGPTFHTRPLLDLLQGPEHYWLLAVSQKEVSLMHGTARGLTTVDLAGVPQSLQAALGAQLVRPSLTYHSPSARSGPVFHGYGVGKDDSKPELEKFFRQIDAGLHELLGDDVAPLILAAVDYYHPIYRSISRLDHLAPEGIQGNVSSWSDERLHEAAWPLVRREVERKQQLARDLWEAAYKKDKTESDLSVTARLAVGGRVRLLMTERDRRFWGMMDRHTGTVEVVRESGTDPGENAVELLDELAEIVILRGGNALVLASDQMPTTTGVAAVLR